MKKVLLIMAAALMTMTQCRKQETVPATPSANTIKMTITAGPGAKTDINTATGAITWTSGDVLYVSDGTKWLGSLTLQSGADNASGTFTGTIQGIGEGTTTCHFFYLGKGNIATTPTGTAAANISLASQDGTLRGENGAMKYHMGYGIADVTVSEGVATAPPVGMSTKIAIAHLKLKMDGVDYKGKVTMDVSNTMTVSPAGTFSSGGNGIAIGNNGGTSGDRYVTLIPTGTSSVDVSFSGSATGNMTFGHGIQANNLYGMANGIEVTLTHEYVDLGLPSGLLWATCNLGADSPEKYGDYYQWGGVTSVTSTDINVGWAGCPFTNGTYSPSNQKVFTKYVPTGKTEYWAGNGDPDNKLVLDPEDDAAHVNWGSDWRMPTSADWNELYDNTTSAWTGSYNGTGVKGRVFTSKNNGETLFLPAAGNREKQRLNYAGYYGYYWSSSLSSSYPRNAYSMYFYSGDVDPQLDLDRYYGCTVRRVRVAR